MTDVATHNHKNTQNELSGSAAIRAKRFLQALATENIDTLINEFDIGELIDRPKAPADVVKKQLDLIVPESMRASITADKLLNVELYPPTWLSRYAWEAGNSRKGSHKVVFDNKGKPLWIYSSESIQAGFDCINAVREAEKTICSSSELASIDFKMTNAYTDANRFLTGKDIVNLKSEQIQFIRKRNMLGNDVPALMKITQERTNKLKESIQHAFDSNLVVATDKTIKSEHSIDGEWASQGEGFQTASCSNAYIHTLLTEYKFNVSVEADRVLITRQNKDNAPINVHCRIESSQTFSYAPLYHKTFDNNAMWGGTCGYRTEKLPYRGYITYYRLIPEQGEQEELEDGYPTCGGLSFSFNEAGYRAASLHPFKHELQSEFPDIGYVLKVERKDPEVTY